MAKKIEGVLVASFTPFTKEGEIDGEVLKGHIKFLAEKGVDGIFASGTYGEGPMLSPDDYQRFDRLMVEAVRENDMFVIAQVGSPSTRQVIQQAEIAAEAGVDAIAAVPAFYYKHDEEAIYSYYRDVTSATDLPFFIYNNPARTGFEITPQFLSRLIQLDNIVGMKDSSDRLLAFCKFKQVVGDKFNLIIGTDDLVLAGLLMGAKGAVLVVGNVFPEIPVQLYRAFKEGDYEKAVQLQYRMLEIRTALKGPYIATYKAALELRGRKGGYARKPLRELTPEEKKKLEAKLRDLALI